MLDVTARSMGGRACVYTRNDIAVQTPLVIQTCRDAAGDMHIRVDDSGRTFFAMGDEAPLDPKLRYPVSRGKGEVTAYGSIAVVRLPFEEGCVIPEGTEIVVIANAYELRGDFRRAISQISAVRKSAGHGILLVAPGLAEPSTIAMYAYMGIDVFDDSLSRVLGAEGIEAFSEGNADRGKDSVSENISEMNRECSKVRTFTVSGRLRELVDQRAPSSPSSVAMLRIFDDICYAYQEEATPVVGTRFSCNTTQSLMRPDVLRYRKAIMEMYERPSHKRILLLLPCSARKPYHKSKTHKMFSSAIHTAGHDTAVHEVILTSPLGMVPRELDIFYPANSYDIPVTGQWKCQERDFIRELFSRFLSFGYEKVVSHLGSSTDLIRDMADIIETVVDDDPVSQASLDRLDRTLRDLSKGMPSGEYMADRKETVRSVLTFQFGKDVADRMMDAETFAVGKYPYWKIMRGKTQLGMMSEERGMVSLTIDGAEIFASMGVNLVEVQGFELKGSLFAVGVKAADHRIRIGDEAVIVADGEVIAVGVAQMSGREMEDMNRGIAVKIRHRK